MNLKNPKFVFSNLLYFCLLILFLFQSCEDTEIMSPKIDGDEISLELKFDQLTSDLDQRIVNLYSRDLVLLNSDTFEVGESLFLNHKSNKDEEYILAIVTFQVLSTDRNILFIDLYNNVKSGIFDLTKNKFVGEGEIVIENAPTEIEQKNYFGNSASASSSFTKLNLKFIEDKIPHPHIGIIKELEKDQISYYLFEDLSPGFSDTIDFSDLNTSNKKLEISFQENLSYSRLDGTYKNVNFRLSEFWSSDEKMIEHYIPNINFSSYQIHHNMSQNNIYYKYEEALDDVQDKTTIEIPELPFKIENNTAEKLSEFSLSRFLYKNSKDENNRVFVWIHSEEKENTELETPELEELIRSFYTNFEMIDLNLSVFEVIKTNPKLEYQDIIQRPFFDIVSENKARKYEKITIDLE